jgi:hypothetical protein
MYSDYPDYEVSDFYEPEWYVNTARSAGAEAEIVYDSEAPYDAPAEIGRLYSSFSEWTKSESKKLTPLMRYEIMRELSNYSARLFQSYSEHIIRNAIDDFSKRWVDPLTRILVRKPTV